MYFVRPIRESDFDDLKNLAANADVGFTSLPNDADYLLDKIHHSTTAFGKKVLKPRGESYLFALENTVTHRIEGISGIVSKVGGFDPFYTYKIKTERHKDADLNVNKYVRVLHLSANHDGPSEICSLFILPKARSGGVGRLLSLSRFLFMAEFPKRFDKKVISELRGFIDAHGKSPFWECVGRHFFETDFGRADFLSGLGNKEFIKNLMPKHPIYIPLLPQSVQDVIGHVHPHTEPALHLLKSEGFVYEDEVDIFDAGPTVSTALTEIRTARQSRVLRIERLSDKPINAAKMLVSNARLNFRALVAPLKITEDGVTIQVGDAKLLEVKVGDEIRFVSLK